jgi:hypothetical protein
MQVLRSLPPFSILGREKEGKEITMQQKYSPGETHILNILSRRKRPIDTYKLVELYYGDETPPFNSRNSVISTVRSLARKAKLNNEPFRIVTSNNRGPTPLEVSLEKISGS